SSLSDHQLFHSSYLFFFTAPATTDIYTLSLHDALPICRCKPHQSQGLPTSHPTFHMPCSYFHGQMCLPSACLHCKLLLAGHLSRSEEHTSELQSRENLVCRLLLEKKKPEYYKYTWTYVA